MIIIRLGNEDKIKQKLLKKTFKRVVNSISYLVDESVVHDSVVANDVVNNFVAVVTL